MIDLFAGITNSSCEKISQAERFFLFGGKLTVKSGFQKTYSF